MGQSRQGIWVPQPDGSGRGGRGYLRPQGDGAPVAGRRPAAGSAARGADRGRAQGPDRNRAARALIIRTLALGLIAGLAACQPSASSAVEVAQSPAGLDQVPLTVTSNGRQHRFTVEVARSTEEQARGLMYRNALAPDRGMVFP